MVHITDLSRRSTDTFEQIPISRVIETYPQLIGYNTDFYDYVREQTHLCNLDLNLTYPQTGGNFPSIHIKYGQIKHRLGAGQQRRDLQSDPHDLKENVDLATRQWPPPPFNATLTGKVNKFFGCDVRDLVLTYAFNYSLPWTVLAPTFDYLAIPMTVNPLTVSDRHLHVCRILNWHTAPHPSSSLDE
jgi:carboxypeptidase D